MQYSLYKQILYAMRGLSHRQEAMPKDLLGCSLAYNCFLPRLSDDDYLIKNLKSKGTKKALYSNAKILTKVLQTKKFQHSGIESSELICVLFDDSNFYYSTHLESMDKMDFLGMIRRLSPFFVIHDSIFIDEYQILESAIGGADMVILDIYHLRAYCQCVSVLEYNAWLLDSDISDIAKFMVANYRNFNEVLVKEYIDKLMMFAYNLGLAPIVRIRDMSDLELLFSLRNFPHCIYATHDAIGGVDLLPKESIIFKKSEDNADLPHNFCITITIPPDI